MPKARLPRRLAPLVLLALAAIAACRPVAAQADALHEGLFEESTRIPALIGGAGGGRVYHLSAFIARPEGDGPFPVVVVTHGAPRIAADRARMTPEGSARQVRDFARRGWAAISVMRRGYGASDGAYAEDAGRCDRRDYETAGRESAEDVRGAIGWIAAQPWADHRRILLVGVSAGGFAMSALGADPPAGAIGIVSFAGGRGSRAPDDVCQPERLVAAFRAFGRTTRLPALWIYAENDRFFGPELAWAMHSAYAAGGTPVELAMLSPFGEDGHYVYGAAHSRWWPLVDLFLRRHGWPTWSPDHLTLSGARAAPANGVPAEAAIANGLAANGLPANGVPANGAAPNAIVIDGVAINGSAGDRLRDAFERYLAGPGEKAMAIAGTGAFGWATGRNSTREAREDALAFCRRSTNAACRLRFVNLAPVP